jgi:hypothetical protein
VDSGDALVELVEEVQQRLDEDEFNMFRTRAAQGAKGAWKERDQRFKAALARYEGNDDVR